MTTSGQRAEWWREICRAAHETVEAKRVGEYLVGRLASWMPLASWSVYVPDGEHRPPHLLATTQAVEQAQDALADLAARAMRESSDLFVPNLKTRARRAPARAALAWALHARGRTVAALVGLDGAPSRALPAGAGAREAAGHVLEVLSAALDSALRVEHAERLAATDDLTQLFNARFLGDALRREVKRADRGRRRLSLLFLDLDAFKSVNDRWGHLAGSRALVEFSRVIARAVRESDVVARFGGDEFAVILPDTPRAGALAVADRVRDRVRRHRFLAETEASLRLSVSIGTASLSSTIKTPEALLHAADTAMYQAKAQGGNRVCVATSVKTAGSAPRPRTTRVRAGEERRR